MCCHNSLKFIWNVFKLKCAIRGFKYLLFIFLPLSNSLFLCFTVQFLFLKQRCMERLRRILLLKISLLSIGILELCSCVSLKILLKFLYSWNQYSSLNESARRRWSLPGWSRRIPFSGWHWPRWFCDILSFMSHFANSQHSPLLYPLRSELHYLNLFIFV